MRILVRGITTKKLILKLRAVCNITNVSGLSSRKHEASGDLWIKKEKK